MQKSLYSKNHTISFPSSPRLKAHQFPPLRHLRKIDLSKNQLSSVDPLAFQNLAQSDVEEVNLSGNRLSRMSEGTFVVLKGLKHLQLSDNPWHCDCQLQSFRDYVVHKAFSNPTPYSYRVSSLDRVSSASGGLQHS